MIWAPLYMLVCVQALSGIWSGRLPECWKSEPESEDEFKGVVEWEPVDGIDCALKQTVDCQLQIVRCESTCGVDMSGP